MHNDILLHCVTTRINQDAFGLFVVITILMKHAGGSSDHKVQEKIVMYKVFQK
jgi:hypothetical protein